MLPSWHIVLHDPDSDSEDTPGSLREAESSQQHQGQLQTSLLLGRGKYR